MLSRLFRRLFLAAPTDCPRGSRLAFFGEIAGLADREAFAALPRPAPPHELGRLRQAPFAGPEAVLAYLARYTHRVAIANSRLVALDERGVTFRCKDYRRNGPARYAR